MIEILNIDDINKICDPNIKKYLEYSFDRLPDDYIYPDYGYFIVLDNIEELFSDTNLDLSFGSIKGLNDGLIDCFELMEEKYDVVELVFILDNDFGLSFIIKKDIFNDSSLKSLFSS